MRHKLLALAAGVVILASGPLPVRAASTSGSGAEPVGEPKTTPGELSYFKYLRAVADSSETQVGRLHNNFASMINRLASILTIAAGVMFFFLILSAGYKLVFASDKEGALREVRKRLTIGIVGLIVVMAAYWISQLLLKVTGLNTLPTD